MEPVPAKSHFSCFCYVAGTDPTEMKIVNLTLQVLKITSLTVLPLSLMACNPVPAIPDKSELDIGKNVSTRPSSPLESGRSRKSSLSGDFGGTAIIASRQRVISRAKTFFSSYENEEPNPYFTKEYPPEIDYDAISERFYITVENGHLGSQIRIILNKTAEKGNIIFGNGLGIGDPPTKDTRPKSCHLFDIEKLKELVDKYFINGDLKRKSGVIGI